MYYKDYDGVKVTFPSTRENIEEHVYVVPKPTGEDDSDLIQKALDRGKGGIVFLPPYTYKSSKTLYVPEFTSFIGSGLESHIEFTGSDDLDEIPLRTIGSKSTIKPFITNERPEGVLKTQGVFICNIHVTGEEVTDETRLGGVVFADAENCHTDLVFVNYVNWSPDHNVGRRGFNLLTVRSVNCTFNRGMLDHGGYECLGIYDDSINIMVTNVLMKNGMRCSAQIHQGAKDIIFTNNTLILDEAGDYTNGNLLLHGREGEDTTVKDVLISDNIMRYTGSVEESTVGIAMIEYTEDVTINNNIIKGQTYGVNMGGMCRNFDVSNNEIDVTDIGVRSGTSSNIPGRFLEGMTKIQGNSIVGCKTGISLLNAETELITGNYINADDYGISLDTIVEGALIDNNVIKAGVSHYRGFGESDDNITIGENLLLDELEQN